jgi:hypothetical protein
MECKQGQGLDSGFKNDVAFQSQCSSVALEVSNYSEHDGRPNCYLRNVTSNGLNPCFSFILIKLMHHQVLLFMLKTQTDQQNQVWVKKFKTVVSNSKNATFINH